jgi:hypothetical protein
VQVPALLPKTIGLLSGGALLLGALTIMIVKALSLQGVVLNQ